MDKNHLTIKKIKIVKILLDFKKESCYDVYSKGGKETMNENKGQTIFLSVIGIATLLVAIIGATFAYFTTTLTTTEQSGSFTTARVGDVTATVVNNVNSSALIYPGWSGSGSTTVYYTTASDIATPYTCKMNVTTFDSGLDDLYIQTSGTDGQKNDEIKITQTGDIPLASGTLQASSTLTDDAYGDKHVVNYTVRYKETGTEQNTEQGKNFAATVSCSLAGSTIYYNQTHQSGSTTPLS